MGSTGLDKLKEQNTGGNNPGVEGALDVDPDVIGGYTCATAEAAERQRPSDGAGRALDSPPRRHRQRRQRAGGDARLGARRGGGRQAAARL